MFGWYPGKSCYLNTNTLANTNLVASNNDFIVLACLDVITVMSDHSQTDNLRKREVEYGSIINRIYNQDAIWLNRICGAGNIYCFLIQNIDNKSLGLPSGNDFSLKSTIHFRLRVVSYQSYFSFSVDSADYWAGEIRERLFFVLPSRRVSSQERIFALARVLRPLYYPWQK